MHSKMSGRLAGAASAGEGIRQLRVDLGYSMRQVEENTRISAGYLANIELGHQPVTLTVLDGLAEALELSPSEYRSLYRAAGVEYLQRHGWDPDVFVECVRRSDELEPTFGDTIRRYRKEHGIASTELAAEMQIHPSYLSRLENNRERPSVKLAVRLAERLDLNPIPLFSLALSDSISRETDSV